MFRLLGHFIHPLANRYLFWGTIFFAVGLLLTPFIIGLPIVFIGWLLIIFGSFLAIFRLFPFAPRVENEVKKTLGEYFNFLKKLLEELRR